MSSGPRVGFQDLPQEVVIEYQVAALLFELFDLLILYGVFILRAILERVLLRASDRQSQGRPSS